MVVDIFIRSYEKDLEWLSYALKSIYKNVTGFRSIIVAVPVGTDTSKIACPRIIEVGDLSDGYIGQQLSKMESWRHSKAEAILFWDSDTIAYEKLHVSEFYKDGKPIIYKTKYTSIDTPWKPITEKAVGFEVEWEYMRRLPLLYFCSTLFNVEQYFNNDKHGSLQQYLKGVKNREFSEFNVIGALAEKFDNDKYHFIDTESVDMPKSKIKQYWSWGGITPEIKDELDSL